MVTKKLGDYDIKLLTTAREMIYEVYKYNHGDIKLQRQIGRLEAILTRLDSLIAIESNSIGVITQ